MTYDIDYAVARIDLANGDTDTWAVAAIIQRNPDLSIFVEAFARLKDEIEEYREEIADLTDRLDLAESDIMSLEDEIADMGARG